MGERGIGQVGKQERREVGKWGIGQGRADGQARGLPLRLGAGAGVDEGPGKGLAGGAVGEEFWQ
jgi:hypothetical protein